MLTLITGQPGNGKTLYALGLVERARLDPLSVQLGRKVYQSGIPELSLPWEPLEDPERWWELPDGSIVVIDECQRVFPPRKQGAPVPVHVREFETHRHRGFDVFLITQHPQLLDIAVRKLTGRHYHLRRTFGQEAAQLLQWEECTDPNDRGAQSKALRSRWAFDREMYAKYKSSELHTVQRKLPVKPLAVLAGSVVGIVALGVLAGSMLMQDAEAPAQVAEAGLEVPQAERGLREAVRESWEPRELAARVPHWLWSAPFYDEVREVQSAPRVTGCMSIRVDDRQECRCSNGQGVADVSMQVCREFMAGRVYDPMRPAVDVKAENIAYLNARDSASRQSESEGQTFTARTKTAGETPAVVEGGGSS